MKEHNIMNQNKTGTQHNYTALDLFCGCGGMSWGLQKKGFKVLAGFDTWEIALKTYQHNHQDAKIYNVDLSETDPHKIMQDLNLQQGELDVITGGPPCQGFSKNVPASWRFLEDKRNQLYKAYLNFVDAFRPKVVIIENVAEIYNAFNGIVRDEILTTLANWGYKTTVKIVKMPTYGIPQARRRCFFFATNTGVRPKFPQEISAEVSAWDAISDLPVVLTGETATTYDTVPQNAYQKHMRRDICDNELHNHVAKKLSPIQQARISSIKAGQALRDMPPELQVKGGYSGAYGRLDYTGVAPTITRWVFHPGSGRYSHPREPRVITIREAARIQAFSDDFEFLGSYTEQAGQIGNAVPALFMELMADSIIDCLQCVEREDQQPDLWEYAQEQC